MPERYLVILTARVVKDTIPPAYQHCPKCSQPYTWEQFRTTPRMPLRLMLAVTQDYKSSRLCQHIMCFDCVTKNSDNIHEFLDELKVAKDRAPLFCCGATSASTLATTVELDDALLKIGKNEFVHPIFSEYSKGVEFDRLVLEPAWDILLQDFRTQLREGFTLAELEKLADSFYTPPA